MSDLELSISVSDQTEKVGSITEKHFGNIMVNKYGAKAHVEEADKYGLDFFRFPGGTIAEHSKVVNGTLILNDQRVTHEALDGDRMTIGYDITHPELISPLALYEGNNVTIRTDVITFSEALAFSVERGTEFNLIIPVQRYYLDRDLSDASVLNNALEAARADVEIFTERLISGQFNGGVLPKTLLFDIGNEPYSDPFGYATIAKEIIDTIESKLSKSGIAYEIGFQMGKGSATHRSLLEEGYFDAYLPEGEPVLESMLNFEASDQHEAGLEERIFLTERAMLHILGDTRYSIDYVRHHHLSVDVEVLDNESSTFHQRELISKFWQEQISDPIAGVEKPEYYISAWTTDASNANNVAYTLAAAINVLAIYKNFAETGVDRAAFWGLVSSYNYAPGDMLPTVVSDLRSGIVSPSLNIISMLAENVVNSDYIDVVGPQSANGQVEYQLFAFESDKQYTFYVAAGELKSSILNLNLTFEGIALEYSFDAQHLQIVDGSATGQSHVVDRAYDVENSGVSVEFDQDYEIIQIIVPKNADLSTYEKNLVEKALSDTLNTIVPNKVFGSDNDNSIVGTALSDVIFGRGGDDYISGGGGRTNYFGNVESERGHNNSDLLFGGAGDDTLYGNDGDDILHGGDGDDYLIGGGGADTFVFTAGNDRIEDYDYRLDALKFSRDLLQDDNGKLGERISYEGNDLILDFAMGHSLTLQGVGDLSANDLGFVGSYDVVF